MITKTVLSKNLLVHIDCSLRGDDRTHIDRFVFFEMETPVYHRRIGAADRALGEKQALSSSSIRASDDERIDI